MFVRGKELVIRWIRETLRQERPRARAHGDLIAAIDGAVAVHVGAEVRRSGGLTGAGARLQRVSGVDEAVAIRVADEDTDRHNKVTGIGPIAYVRQCYRDSLRIRYTSEVDSNNVVPLPLLPLTEPAPAVTDALGKLTALEKVRTTW